MNNSKKTISDIVSRIKINLVNHYSGNEIQNFIYLIFEYLLNYTKIDIHINSNKTISDKTEKQVNEIIDDLKRYKPVQYIFGKTEFCGLPFRVSSCVLIPRQETEELVDWLIKDNRGNKTKILDIGTGCGCIAVVLAKVLPHSVIKAIDVSSKAIELARYNAYINRVSVNFSQYDILKYKANKINADYDIIVSNPPYIRESEKSGLPENVLKYEPQESLFVPDDDPLIFYRTIAAFGLQALKEMGRLYFEVNEALANDVAEELTRHNYKKIEIKKDILGKDRMIKAFKVK